MRPASTSVSAVPMMIRQTDGRTRRTEAAREREPVVRSQLAASARRFPPAVGLPIVFALLSRDGDGGDPHIPLLLWWAVEDKVLDDREAILFLLCGAVMALEPPVAALASKVLVDAVVVGDLQRGLIAAGVLAATVALGLVNTL